jgi:hypothetical protein
MLVLPWLVCGLPAGCTTLALPWRTQGAGLAARSKGATAAPDIRSRLFVAQCVPLQWQGVRGGVQAPAGPFARSANPARPAAHAWQLVRQVC